MPLLHNPTTNRLFCHRIQRIIEAGERVEITDEQAEDLKDSQIFVLGDGSVAVDDEAPQRGDDDADESDAPKRETVTRGSEEAEVTKDPKRETRS